MLYRLFILIISAALNSHADARDHSLWEDIHSPADIKIYLYLVDGSSAAELKEQMLQSGPVSVAGQRHFAQAKWLISWYWKKNKQSVDFDKTDVLSDLQITMPYYSGKEADFSEAWSGFYEASVAHELQHLKHGHDAALKIISMTRNTALTSGKSTENINTEIDKIVEQARNNDTAYDKSTSHGRKEGVVI